MTINYLGVALAALAQFAFNAIWYTPVFGRVWGRIHDYDKVPPERQREMMRKMPPLLLAQLVSTVVLTVVLAIFVANLPEWNAYAMAGFFWIGFVVPTQVGAVLFGGTKPEWMLAKLAIMAGASLLSLLIGAGVLRAF